MQIYDIVMLVVLAGSAFYGARKGMAWQIASIGSLVVSYFVSLKFSDQIAPMIQLEPPLNRIASMLGLYLASSLVIWIGFRAVSNAIEKVRLKEFDRQIGGLFGAAKGVLYCVVITFFGVFLSQSSRAAILKSRSGHYIAVLIEKVDPLLPEEVQKKIGPYLQKLDQQLDPDNANADGATVWGGGRNDDWADDEPAESARYDRNSPYDGYADEVRSVKEEGARQANSFVNSTLDRLEEGVKDAVSKEVENRFNSAAESAGFKRSPPTIRRTK
ncbi:MAG: CvpA family protein [Pirellulales bacterium]